MTLMKCPDCQEKVSSRAVACPHCGYPVDGARKSEERLNRLSVLVILAFFLAIAATWGTIFFPGALKAVLEELANLAGTLASRLG